MTQDSEIVLSRLRAECLCTTFCARFYALYRAARCPKLLNGFFPKSLRLSFLLNYVLTLMIRTLLPRRWFLPGTLKPGTLMPGTLKPGTLKPGTLQLGALGQMGCPIRPASATVPGLVARFLQRGVTQWLGGALRLTLVALLVLLSFYPANAALAVRTPNLAGNPWVQVQVPVEKGLLDLAFTADPQHGWMVGTENTLLESYDGGQTWEERRLELDSDRYRFSSVAFSGDEGWIVGQPAIMLHTTDAGQSWSRVPLSEKLPGAPLQITALGPGQAEMVTEIAALYRTSDAGRTWQALVSDTAGFARNISRSPEGRYVSVSARGNFYSTWEPGQPTWTPHQRTSSRRLQNMGYGPQGELWLLARGGVVQLSSADQVDDWQEPSYPDSRNGWGLLDLAYRTPNELWVAGGSGNLFVSKDGGATWAKDQALENIPSNFYNVAFSDPQTGFVLGQQGIVLKYDPNVSY